MAQPVRSHRLQPPPAARACLEQRRIHQQQSKAALSRRPLKCFEQAALVGGCSQPAQGTGGGRWVPWWVESAQ